MADKVKEKKSFFGFEKTGKKFAPTGHRYRSFSPGGAARKEAVRIMQATGKNECEVYIREAYDSHRVRKYTAAIGEDRFLELFACAKYMKQTQEEFKGDEPDFIRANKYFAKIGNPETGQPWTPDELQKRNAEIQPDGSMKLLPGTHNVFSAKTAKTKYIAPKILLPESTVIHPEGETDDEPAAAEPKEKKAKGRPKKIKESEPAPEAAVTE
ncbi:MAG: hypothetical protein WAX79_08615 [Candidatus Omnitrophota bacterium]